MRVLHFVNSLCAGGAETFVAALAIALRRFCDVHVVTYAGAMDAKGEWLQRELQEQGVAVHCLNVRSNARKWLVPGRLSRLISDLKPDAVNCHLEAAELFCAAAASLTRIRPAYVRTIQNLQLHTKSARLLEPYLRNFFDLNIACSEVILRSPSLGLPPEKSVSVDNAICLPSHDHLLNRSSVDELRQELGLPCEEMILLNVGSMTPRGGILQKAQDVIIQAFAASELGSQCLIVFVGDGSHRKQMQELVGHFGIDDSVRFVGITDRVRDYLKVADLALLPSRFEGLPLVGIECVTAGLPLLVSNIPVMNVFDTASIVRCAVEDVADLAQTMTRAVAQIGELKRSAMSSVSMYRERFSIDNAASKYYEHYTSLL